ncbi:transcriptional regulator TbsP [Haladaptatus sp. CMAA 1911]|uniref:transcriptional regulator TbsP n=1 Tax=unclassified Haladaptatus TaxID=2622732 RepID=UPI003753EF39
MSAEATVLDEEFTDMISSFFEDTDSVLIVNPAHDVFRTMMLTASSFDGDLPEMQVLATPDVLKDSLDDFILASHVADLIDRGSLELRTTTDIARSSLIVSDDEVVTVVTLDSKTTGMRSADDELVENVRTTFMEDWDDGDAFNLRTPPLSRVQETLREEIGADAEDDFMMIAESVETIPGEDDELDEVAIALLVAANNEVLLYDISKWGEDTGVASKATFSRTKTRLEDRGLIETEKVPIDVGRPRLRLVLVPDDLEDVDELADKASA